MTPALSRTRMSDLAIAAGVSIATVSRVLGGKKGVAAATRRAVLTALDELGYERQPSGGHPSGLVGLIVPELSNPIFPLFAQHLESLLTTAGYMSVLGTSQIGHTPESDYLQVLAQHQVAGIISVSGLTANTRACLEPYQSLVGRGIPLVAVNGYSPQLSIPFFSCDDTEAITLAYSHLRSLGHSRIGLVVGPQRYVPAQRKIAAFQALAHPASSSILSTQYTFEAGRAAALELCASAHTAIICGSDLIALGAIHGVNSLGLVVPADISVIGFDDAALMAHTHPSLTTVRQPVRALCKAAVAALLEEIAGNKTHRTEMLFRPDLIVRSSTGPVAA